MTTKQHGHAESPPTRPRRTTRGPGTKITERCTPRHPDPLASESTPSVQPRPTTASDYPAFRTGPKRNPRAQASGRPGQVPTNLSGASANPRAQASGHSQDDSGVGLGSGQPSPRVARVRPREPFGRYRVGDVEREHLARGVGAHLRVARARAGLSQRRLAEAAGCTGTTVGRIEAGTRRPRRSMLSSLATVLDPQGAAGLLHMLVTAAGDSLAEETGPGLRRRHRRMKAATTRRRRAANRAQHLLRTAEFTAAAANRRLASAVSLRAMTAALDDVQDAQRRGQVLRAEAAAILARIGAPAPHASTPPHALRPVPVRTDEPSRARSACQAAGQETR